MTTHRYIVTILSDFIPPISQTEREVTASTAAEAREIAYRLFGGIIGGVRLKVSA